MKRAVVITIVAVALAIGFIVVTLVRDGSDQSSPDSTNQVQQNDSSLSETELRQEFRCDRVTADTLATDIYCQNPEYYYEDFKNDTVIDESDFEDPRYKALFEN